jgi:hypothetical protein
MDCQIEVFDKPLCAVEAGVCKEIYMRAGIKKITAISAENPVDRIIIKPKILANEDNYIEIKLSSIKEEREKEELERKHKAEEQKRKEAEEQKRKEVERIRIEEERKKEEVRKLNNHNGHEFVDLGLPSGLKWATCNVGATKPEEYGDYFAWGEVRPKKTYDWSTYKWSNGSGYSLTKYCLDNDYGRVDSKEKLTLSDDAAHTNWGGSWRMPSDEELNELYDNCTWAWTTLNGVKGCKVTSNKNGNSIFLPAAGCCDEERSFKFIGKLGGFWASSLTPNTTYCAQRVFFYSEDVSVAEATREHGLSIRPVCP